MCNRTFSFLYTFLFIFWAKVKMKLTFSCHYHQLGQKKPQCYQTEINQLNLGIYLKKQLFGIMFLQRQKLRLKLPRQLHLLQYWTVFFTGLKLIWILSIFLNSCGKRAAVVVCTGYNIKASFTPDPAEALSLLFSESLQPSAASTAFPALHHHFQCAIFTHFHTPNKFSVSKVNCSNNRSAWGCVKFFNSMASPIYPRPLKI